VHFLSFALFVWLAKKRHNSLPARLFQYVMALSSAIANTAIQRLALFTPKMFPGSFSPLGRYPSALGLHITTVPEMYYRWGGFIFR
jgi:hypothetical protein